jgi:hypothetical protein
MKTVEKKNGPIPPRNRAVFISPTLQKGARLMRNFTIQVTDDIYHHARVAAANRNMSVSALFRAFILTLEKQPNPNQPDGNHFQENFPALGDPLLEEKVNRMAAIHLATVERYMRRRH